MSLLRAVGRNQPRSTLTALPSAFSGRSQGRQQRLKLFAALTANLHMFLDERHGLGGVQAAELHLHEAVQLLEALVAADLYLASVGYLTYQRPEDISVKHVLHSIDAPVVLFPSASTVVLLLIALL